MRRLEVTTQKDQVSGTYFPMSPWGPQLGWDCLDIEKQREHRLHCLITMLPIPTGKLA